MPEDRPLRVIISTIPHLKQRYNTIGDWQIQDDGTILIRVSRMPPISSRAEAPISGRRQEFLVAIHELIEAFLCSEKDITTESVDEFDKKHYETPKMQYTEEEPGDHPESPYRIQHSIATGIERTLAYPLRVNWHYYDLNMKRLMEEYDEQRGREERPELKHDSNTGR